ncbi:MAG: J domain-containing protein [Phycisphaerales bacterium]|nr:MAG: J domain-containing protein [Phycisphaerales bacterium]
MKAHGDSHGDWEPSAADGLEVSKVKTAEQILESRVLRLRDKWACRARDCEDLRAELTRFRQAYHAAVGDLTVRLERIRLKVDRWHVGFEIIERTPDLPTEELRRWIGLRLRDRGKAFDLLEKEVAGDSRAFEEWKRRDELTPREEQLLRRLYRKLAVMYHPDLQLDPEAKRDCEVIMARLNALYRAKDLEGLEIIAEQSVKVVRQVFASKAEYREWLETRVVRLRAAIRELEKEMEELRTSDLAVLKRRHDDAKRAGRDFLREMSEELKAQYEEQRQELFALWERARALPEEVRERLEHAVRI